MGLNIKDLLISKEIEFEGFKGKTLIVDSFNVLYQFITTIRQRDGTPLKDSRGNVTSHLTGLFSRTSNLIQKGIKLGFVFDGKPPEFKRKERERRISLKMEAQKKYTEAVKKGDVEEMKKYAARTSKLTGEMIEESKELLKAFGLPIIQAPSEGEAQVAYIVNKHDAFAGVSEDYDSLLYGIPRLVKNLTISGRRKFGATYVTVKPKIINLTENLNNLGIDNDQLIVLAMIVGTDYNLKGVKGIGPKGALKLVKEFGDDFDGIFQKIEWKKHFDFNWEDVYYLFKKMPVNKDYKLEWGKIDKEKIHELLVEKHDFSAERVKNTLEKLGKTEKEKKQKGLGEWF
ncbi:flap endonuclease-1 [Candidatus Woesearchaeota archaeon]|nr:flap endonuclease-1 [Candidatus Woesearchaeota archaeon]